MGEGTTGSQSDENPPSFIPSGLHRQPRETRGRMVRHAIPDAGGGLPPSFTPSSPSRHDDAPDSFHAGSSRTPSYAPAPHERRPSGHGGPASSSSGRTTGSTGTRPARPVEGRSPLGARPRGVSSHGTQRNPSEGHRPRKGRIGRRILLALLVVLALLALLVFGAWNWVNGRLEKESWLTSASDDTSATTWLILGSDERDGTAGGSASATPGSRTDTILVLVKPRSGPSSLISIPRDSLVTVSGTSMKINAVSETDGRSALVGAVEGITGHKIDHVAEIKFGGLKDVVDALGGVTLCYDQTVNDSYSGLDWTAGCHHANGTTALAFSRMRYADSEGDFGRSARQRKVIAAIVSKATSASILSNPSKVTSVASTALDSVTVDEDTSPSTLLSMALAFRSATGSGGVTGSVYWTNPGYYVSGVGSCVLLDATRNTTLFDSLVDGTHDAGTVGTLAES
ncbi:LCP family protein [uncultured Bifidobacterium sp.]|uniref:LCP family protein n=1 Tax=uncultured Bifidobacterium sp. TaxID=165187 RepID=UPI0028DD0D59|nr:LCP family protein [uncultured Bifidobacterium sp.]